MAEKQQLVRCDECQAWFPMKEDHTFSQPLFSYPTYWFRFFNRRVDEHKVEKELCSWHCAKNFVDRMYSAFHPEDPR